MVLWVVNPQLRITAQLDYASSLALMYPNNTINLPVDYPLMLYSTEPCHSVRPMPKHGQDRLNAASLFTNTCGIRNGISVDRYITN